VFNRIAADASTAQPVAAPKPSLQGISTLVQMARNHPRPFLDALRSGQARAAVQRFVQIYSRPSLTWDDLPFLRERTKLPIVLKGILHPDDARRAVEAGMDGIVVSNHGGRQVDGAISTIAALPAVAQAVDGRIPILLDSGVRGGADVFKALALGARAVMIGRPYAYGLAIAGEDGVREVLRNLAADFDLTMGLSGCREVGEIGQESVVSAFGHRKL
jgi:lactate 2-monooxygenase